MNLLKVLTDKMEWLENREDRAIWGCMGGHANLKVDNYVEYLVLKVQQLSTYHATFFMGLLIT